MKPQFILKTAHRKVSEVSQWADHKYRKGFCTVLSIKCTWCGVWVSPEDWDPKSHVCDVCTAALKAVGVQTRRPLQWIATGNGKPRRNTGAVK